MPQLVRGGKWVFGWAVVGSDRTITIPPEAWEEYGFQVGQEVIMLPGSRRSGGFGLTTSELVAVSPIRAGIQANALTRMRFDMDRRVALPPESGIEPGDRLLVVRGSGQAVGFATQGSICEEARRHTNIDVFGEEPEVC